MKKALFLLLAIVVSFGTLYSADAEKTVEDYLTDLSSKNPARVVDACNWFGKNENVEGYDKMLTLVSHSEESVRIWSSANLGLLKNVEAVNPLIDQLEKETSADVRYTIILAITRLGIKDDEQKERLKKLKRKEKDPIVLDYITKMEEKLK
ncbi:MAG: hypothetical protein PF637_08705 [Spirochaetes bacterium]|jgi:HEAT repeat protein|nr:hypothetical protein [Spirochaetota bacterium]